MKPPKEKGKKMKNPTDSAVLLHHKASQTSVCITRYISIQTHTHQNQQKLEELGEEKVGKLLKSTRKFE